jgi:signal transduction histidine kinase
MKTIESGPSAGLTPQALERLFREFSETSREMERSHAELTARVASLRQELAEKDRRLEQKKRLEALGLVVAGVAHEFRNPLGSLSLYLDCLGGMVDRLPGPLDLEAKGLLEKVEMAVRHLDAVVDDMLILTRGSTPSEEPCDLPRLIEEALALLRNDIDGSGVRCQVVVDPELDARPGGRTVPGDRDHMVRIFVNVVKNAVQAVGEVRPRGEGQVDIEVRPATSPGKKRRRPSAIEAVEVAVIDNGPGVPPERMERLFVPFYTEKQKGVGLGLYIVHSLIERQGGRVDLLNVKGGGLTVRLRFAVRPPSARAAERQEMFEEAPVAREGNGAQDQR